MSMNTSPSIFSNTSPSSSLNSFSIMSGGIPIMSYSKRHFIVPSSFSSSAIWNLPYATVIPANGPFSMKTQGLSLPSGSSFIRRYELFNCSFVISACSSISILHLSVIVNLIQNVFGEIFFRF